MATGHVRRGSPADGRRARLPALLALGLAAIFTALVSQTQASSGAGRMAVLVLDDGGQLLTASAAAIWCWLASRRADPGLRRGWQLLSLGTGSWAAGQLVWSYYEVVAGREVPFPSLADLGFLTFPLLSAAGLVAWLTTAHSTHRTAAAVLDGLIIAGALFTLSWATTLQAVYQAGSQDAVALALSMAYPLGDVLLATLVLVAMARSVSRQRAVLLMLGCGLGSLAMADSLYVYLTATGEYATGNAISGGWVLGFLLIAASAYVSRTARQRSSRPAEPAQDSRLSVWLPYLPLLVAESVFAARLLNGTAVSQAEIALALGLVPLVLVRQFLVLSDNRSLMTQLRDREAELAHKAFHDPLTGLPNRARFMQSLHEQAHAHAADGAPYAVLYCDLDDFKIVNDTYGHGAGDALLKEVSTRLLRCTSDSDLVARLGGDEFAILRSDLSQSPEALADMVVEALGLPVALDDHETSVGVSIGVAIQRRVPPGEATPGAGADGADVLKRADTSMYLAKAGGKGQRVVTPVRGASRVPEQPNSHTQPY